MSEYQCIKFRAIDRTLAEKQLQFVGRQSSRAEFTKWEFEVEYHYSSFRGDINGMLRNGYDIFLTFSNYGQREPRSIQWREQLGDFLAEAMSSGLPMRAPTVNPIAILFRNFLFLLTVLFHGLRRLAPPY